MSGQSRVAKILTLMVFVALLAACEKKNEMHAFDVCLSGNVPRDKCTKILHVNLQTRYASSWPKENYYSIGPGRFQIDLPVTNGQPDYNKNGLYSANIEISWESPEQRVGRYLESARLRPGTERRIEHGDLVVLAESSMGIDQPGALFIVPRDSTQISFNCAKPFRAVAGNMVSNTGCTATAPLYSNVFIQYPIKYQSLEDWKQVNASVIKSARAVLNTTK